MMCERVLVIVLRRKGEFVGFDSISIMEINWWALLPR